MSSGRRRPPSQRRGDQAAEIGAALRITAGDLVAYQQDNVAWLSDRPTFELADGREVRCCRLTAVWLREPDEVRRDRTRTSSGSGIYGEY
jgi:hypothetical protein